MRLAAPPVIPRRLPHLVACTVSVCCTNPFWVCRRSFANDLDLATRRGAVRRVTGSQLIRTDSSDEWVQPASRALPANISDRLLAFAARPCSRRGSYCETWMTERLTTAAITAAITAAVTAAAAVGEGGSRRFGRASSHGARGLRFVVWTASIRSSTISRNG